MRALVIEDDHQISGLFSRSLETNHFAVEQIANGADGLVAASTGAFDIIVLDLMLPDLGGLELIGRLRKQGVQTPVLVLSAKRDVGDRIDALRAGGDDYMVKPFVTDEMFARIEALLRRSHKKSDDSARSLSAGGLTLDLIKREVNREGKIIELQTKEFTLLEYLMRNQGRTITKAQILTHVWQYEFDPQTNVVDVLMFRLRTKIDKDFETKLIHTLRGMGYVFKPNSLFWNRVGFRLGAGCLLLFIVSTSLIFSANYFYLVHSLRAHDHDLIDESFDHYALVYQTAGIEGLKREIQTENSQAVLNQLLLRLQDPKTGAILFYHAPKDISEYNSSLIDKTLREATAPEAIVRIPSKTDNEDELEVMQGKTPDGLIIQVGKNTEDREDFLDSFRNSFLTIAIGCILLGTLGAIFLVSRVLRPVREMIVAIQKIEAGESDVQAVEGMGQDELSQLTRLFNRVWAKNQRLVTGMRLSLDMVAHDLRTPLTRVRGFAEEGLRGSDINTKDASLTECIVSLDETSKLLDLMLEIAESESGASSLKKNPTNCSDLLNSLKDLYSLVAEDKRIQIVVESNSDLTVTADRRLKQALANLTDNALKYSNAGSQIHLSARSAGPSIIFEVKDQGPGIAENDKEKIWKRFYRGNVSNWQPGLGLGLSLVASIVHAHGGQVEIANSDLTGSTFRITMPL